MPKPLKLYWWRESPTRGNFGDELSPLIVGAMTKQSVAWSNDSGKLLAIGSIVSRACENDVVWGSGCFTADDFIAAKQVKILAVRGPLTRDVLLKRGFSCPEVYGDPACLTPKLFPHLEAKPNHEIGILPHWCDREIVQERYSSQDNLRIIDPFAPPLQVIEEMSSCRILLSSSLHGIIVADSFNIPSCYVRFRNQPAGFFRQQGRDHFKFFDYFMTVGRELLHPILLLDRGDLQRAAQQAVCGTKRINSNILIEILLEHYIGNS